MKKKSAQPKFEPEYLDSYWNFVNERHSIWYRRFIKEQDPPWTKDPILRDKFFTNMYRILDPGTQFAMKEIVKKQAPVPDKIFNLLIYRLMASNEGSFSALGFQALKSWSRENFEKRLKDYRERGNKPFGSAYMVNAYHMIGHSKDKIENVGAIFEILHNARKDWWNEISKALSPSYVYDVLISYPGIGNFLAYQVFVDATYPVLKGKPLLPFDQNAWAAAGPGAKVGLSFLLGKKPKNELPYMRWLQSHQNREFSRIGVSFPYLKDKSEKKIPLSLADIQNTLCEFGKYCRIKEGWTGKGAARGRKFVPSS